MSMLALTAVTFVKSYGKRLAIFLVALILILGGLYVYKGKIYDNGYADGKEEVTSAWALDVAAKDKAALATLAERVKENEILKKEYESEREKSRKRYQAAINKLKSAELTGLQLPEGTCKGNSSSGSALPASDGSSSGATSPSSLPRLPREIERRLRLIADDANRCTQNLLELQALYKERK